MTRPIDIAVIGGGIVGISAALALQAAGRTVTVIERDGIGAGASFGNAGAFAFADVIPLATPGIMRRAPGWLFDPLGPLSIPPAYATRIAPWLVKFGRASLPRNYRAGVAAQSALMDLSRTALERQITAEDGEDLILRQGQLQLYEGAKEYRASLPDWQLRRDHGIRFDLLDRPGAIAEIQPGLAPRFTHAAFTPDWINTTDPMLWLQHLANRFRARGGQVEHAELRALTRNPEGVTLHLADGPRQAAQAIVAAGAWSQRIAATLGDRIPLETERGYNTTLPAGAFDLRTHLTFPSHGFVVTRIGEGLRVGGAVELGGLDLPPNFRRANVLLDKAARFLPALNTGGGRQWMGFRPSLPDSLPVIGPAPGGHGVIYAFGHGHLGLTQAAATAEIVAALALGRTPPLDIAPYAATRF